MRTDMTKFRPAGQHRASNLMDFGELRERVGFNDYYEISAKYSSSNRESG